MDSADHIVAAGSFFRAKHSCGLPTANPRHTERSRAIPSPPFFRELGNLSASVASDFSANGEITRSRGETGFGLGLATHPRGNTARTKSGLCLAPADT